MITIYIALPSKNFNKFQTCKNAVDAQHDVSLALCGRNENIAKGTPQTSQVAGAWSERQKMFHGGSFLKLADDDMDIQNPEAQNRELGGF